MDGHPRPAGVFGIRTDDSAPLRPSSEAWVLPQERSSRPPSLQGHLPETPLVALTGILRGLAIGCGLAALIAPKALRLAYLAVTVIGIPIGYVVSHVVLAVIFFGVLTPTGLLLRFFKGDPIHRRWERGRASYFTARLPSAPRRYFRTY